MPLDRDTPKKRTNRSVVLSFCRSVVLSFCRSVVLSFCRSVVLSFCRSDNSLLSIVACALNHMAASYVRAQLFSIVLD